jgi:hypothetical protein
MVGGGPDDEIADTAADLQCQGMAIAEDPGPVNGACQLPDPDKIGRIDMDERLSHLLLCVCWLAYHSTG